MEKLRGIRDKGQVSLKKTRDTPSRENLKCQSSHIRLPPFVSCFKRADGAKVKKPQPLAKDESMCITDVMKNVQ